MPKKPVHNLDISAGCTINRVDRQNAYQLYLCIPFINKTILEHQKDTIHTFRCSTLNFVQLTVYLLLWLLIHKHHHLIELIHDRLSKTIIEHFIKNYSLSERQAVKTVSIDLNANYQSVIHKIFPNAQIIVNRFHIVQLYSRALDQVRISCLKKINDKHSRLYKALKSNWHRYEYIYFNVT